MDVCVVEFDLVITFTTEFELRFQTLYQNFGNFIWGEIMAPISMSHHFWSQFMRSTLPLWVFVLAKTPLRAPAAGCSPVSRSHRWPSLLACTHGCTCLAGDYFQALPLVLCWYQNTCIDIYESIHIYTNMRSTYENCTYVTQYSNNSIYVDIISNSFMVYSR